MATNTYKETINLPKTDFPMKGNLPQTEPHMIKAWEANKIYEKMVSQNDPANKFVMPDGPPYANGNIHVGHVLNKVLKDIIIKYKNMCGQRAAFIPGWDCHGLPIELKVTKRLGSKGKEMSPQQIRQECRKEALKWVDTQREQFIRLGILAQWDKPYLTLSPDYEAAEIRVLAKIQKNGILYRGEKPVYWCTKLQTALAAAEVEYHDHTSPSIFVKFFLKPEDQQKIKNLPDPQKPLAFVIWTTTPWTLPANLAIALHPQFSYGLYEANSEYWIIAKDLKESFEKETGVSLKGPFKEFKGKELEGLKTQHPFMQRDSIIVLGEHVTLDAGTGCVHTAPGHGLEDYQVGLKYNLPTLSPVDPAGRYTQEVPQYQGMKIWDANSVIVEDLKKSGHLIFHSQITHSYPHNPRSKTPLIFRATPQWFIRMDEPHFPLRKKALEAVEKNIQFVPEWGRQRLQAMIQNTPDWCLSRQRIWGVPIPVFYCTQCEEPLVNEEIMNRVADSFEKDNKGIEAFHETPTDQYTKGFSCTKCGSKEFRKSQDILDVWFDSGVCHTAVQQTRKDLGFPADIYLEGSDQHRGWFQTSLLSSIAAYEQPPFRALITHGFVNDSEGYKMSKSRGNVISPSDVIKKYGAEILRLWVAYEDYGQDVSISEEMFQRITETYRRFRNTIRFMLGNLKDFDFSKHAVPYDRMTSVDQWALFQLNQLILKIRKAFDNYDFYKSYHALNHYFTVTLSSFYLDILKDRLYTAKTEGLPRRSAQTVIFLQLKNLLPLMAPILSFLSEEAYKYLQDPDKKESIFLLPFPEPQEEWDNLKLDERFQELLKLRAEVSKKLEELRKNKTIGSSLEAQVQITVPEHLVQSIQDLKVNLEELFIVSKVTLSPGEKEDILVKKAEGEKCVRCWNYHVEVNKSSQWPGLCPKCIEALS